MSIVDIMIDQIGDARRVLEDGKPVVPVWVIKTPEGSYRIYTEFNAGAARTCVASGFPLHDVATRHQLCADGGDEARATRTC